MFLGIFNNDVFSWIGRIIVILFIGSITYSHVSSEQIRKEYVNNVDIMYELSKTNEDIKNCQLRFWEWKAENPHWTWEELSLIHI